MISGLVDLGPILAFLTVDCPPSKMYIHGSFGYDTDAVALGSGAYCVL